MKLDQKTLVLTGASGGLGQALAHALAPANALVLVGRNDVALAAVKHTLPEPDRHRVCAADITTACGRAQLLAAVSTLPGGIDGLINNAAVSEFAFLERHDDESIQSIIATNLTAPILLSKALLPLLRTRPEALIANIGSSFGGIGYPGFASYSASKFGLHGFSEALRRELSGTGILVSYIAPRAIKTSINSAAVTALNQTLGNAMDEPQKVAAHIVRALSHRPGKDSFLGWPEALFVRINALFPALVDGALRRQLPTIREFSLM